MLVRAHELMEKYSDRPMDFADASVVALAEALNVKRVWTLDSDFDVYRFRGREPFELIR
jgi:predicted nucleic acid-binding protein